MSVYTQNEELSLIQYTKVGEVDYEQRVNVTLAVGVINYGDNSEVSSLNDIYC